MPSGVPQSQEPAVRVSAGSSRQTAREERDHRRKIVRLDEKGVSQFNALLTTKGRDAAGFYAFDLIWLNGLDLRRKPLVERKARLCELVRKSRCPRLLYAQQ